MAEDRLLKVLCPQPGSALQYIDGRGAMAKLKCFYKRSPTKDDSDELTGGSSELVFQDASVRGGVNCQHSEPAASSRSKTQ
jgi:hypothetical protein